MLQPPGIWGWQSATLCVGNTQEEGLTQLFYKSFIFWNCEFFVTAPSAAPFNFMWKRGIEWLITLDRNREKQLGSVKKKKGCPSRPSSCLVPPTIRIDSIADFKHPLDTHKQPMQPVRPRLVIPSLGELHQDKEFFSLSFFLPSESPLY